MNKIDVIRKIIKAKKDKLNIFIPEPFGTKYKMNLCFYKLCFLLEEGTNKLVYKDGNDNSIPITTRIFHTYLKMNRPGANTALYKIKKAGMIFKLSIYGKEVYYLNPKYAFNGDEIPYFLMKLFERDDELLYNENKFKIKEVKNEDNI